MVEPLGEKNKTKQDHLDFIRERSRRSMEAGCETENSDQ